MPLPEKIKSALTKSMYLYQRSFWYVSQAKGELLKPLGFWNETLLILTYFAVSGIKPTLKEIIGAYVVILLAAAVLGKFIVWLGIVKYNTKIGNQQNVELMKILDKVEELERIIKTQATDVPMGVSQWREHGKRYGYWEFFEKEVEKIKP